MSQEKPNRRDVLKMVAGAGALTMIPDAGQAEEKKTLGERLIELKDKVADIKGRFERLKSITPPELRKGVAHKSGPEFKRRIKTLKDDAEVGTAEAALMTLGTEQMNGFGDQYGILEGIEKEMDALLKNE